MQLRDGSRTLLLLGREAVGNSQVVGPRGGDRPSRNSATQSETPQPDVRACRHSSGFVIAEASDPLRPSRRARRHESLSRACRAIGSVREGHAVPVLGAGRGGCSAPQAAARRNRRGTRIGGALVSARRQTVIPRDHERFPGRHVARQGFSSRGCCRASRRLRASIAPPGARLIRRMPRTRLP
jgi:hypothetical protein